MPGQLRAVSEIDRASRCRSSSPGCRELSHLSNLGRACRHRDASKADPETRCTDAQLRCRSHERGHHVLDGVACVGCTSSADSPQIVLLFPRLTKAGRRQTCSGLGPHPTEATRCRTEGRRHTAARRTAAARVQSRFLARHRGASRGLPLPFRGQGRRPAMASHRNAGDRRRHACMYSASRDATRCAWCTAWRRPYGTATSSRCSRKEPPVTATRCCRFTRNLIQAAITANAPVQTVALRFVDAASGTTSRASQLHG